MWRRALLLPKGPAGLWYAARALVKNREELRLARRARWLREVEGWSPAELMIAWLRVALGPDLILTTSTNPSHLRQTAVAARREVPGHLVAMLQGLTSS